MIAVRRCLYRREHTFLFGADRDDELWFDVGYVCGHHARRFRAIVEPGGVWEHRFDRPKFLELRGRLLRAA